MLGNHRFFAILVLSVILSIAISNSQGINRMFSQDRRYFPTPTYQDPTGKIASSRSLNMTAEPSNLAPQARQYDGGWGGWNDNDGDGHSFFSSFGKGGDGPTHGGSGGWNSHGGAHSFFSESGRGGYGSSHGGGKGYGSSHGEGKGYGSSHGGGKGYGSSHGGGKGHGSSHGGGKGYGSHHGGGGHGSSHGGGYGSSHGGGWSGGSYSGGSYEDHGDDGHGYQGPYYHRQQGGMELPIIGGLGALGLLGLLFYALSYQRPNTTVIIYNASGRRRRAADDFDSDYPLEGENWAELLSRVGKYFEKSWGGDNESPKIKPFKLY